MTASAEQTQSTVLRVSDAAREVVLSARNDEREPGKLALFVEINGELEGAYTYDIWFQALQDAGASDVVEFHGELPIAIVATSVDRVAGATLDVGDAGLVIVNPNTPPRPKSAIDIPVSDLSSPIELAVLEVLETEVNPQIAMHGGRADLVAVDENNIAYVRLSGGCQGCAMSQATLSQGIAVAIKEALPEIAEIIDITAHADGTNPYFEAASH